MSAIALEPLDRERDLGAVAAIYDRAADYLALESGLCPDLAAQAFFDDQPPAGSEAPFKFGVTDNDGGLVAIGDLAYGYPDPDDAYLGLLLLVPESRGRGLGETIFAEVQRIARLHGASRLLVGVIEANTRARAFWERQGFTLTRTSGPHVFGQRQHVVHRFELSLAGPCEKFP